VNWGKSSFRVKKEKSKGAKIPLVELEGEKSKTPTGGPRKGPEVAGRMETELVPSQPGKGVAWGGMIGRKADIVIPILPFGQKRGGTREHYKGR